MNQPILTTTRKVSITNEDEYHWTISPIDGVVELKYWETDETDGRPTTIKASVTMAPDAARMIAKAILKLADELEEKA